jgi:K+ transporter
VGALPVDRAGDSGSDHRVTGADTGAFSLTMQAVQLGFTPRLTILHTSSEAKGQIYLPVVNWVLMFACIGLVLGFGSSSHLAAAYGVSITSTMLITTVLFYVVARWQWKWNAATVGALATIFLVIDLAFLVSNFTKILHGAGFRCSWRGPCLRSCGRGEQGVRSSRGAWRKAPSPRRFPA